jgi:predicted nucleotidyltransferase component of viral defense system
MLTQPNVKRYAHQSGLRDMMIAEKEVILTYALQLFAERGILDKLAFKGGTCLRKMHLGSQGRFSTDLDFTAIEEHNPEELILEMMDAFEEPFNGVTFELEDEYYETQDGLSWGINPTYKHDWNPGGDSEIKMQISFRETPTMPVETLKQCDQSYFSNLEFKPVNITSLALEEMIAEKIRACYQRDKARDIYDLGVFAKRPLNKHLIRRLVVLKLWQAKDAFDPDKLIAKFSEGKDFDWSDLGQLVHKDYTIDARQISKDCAAGYAFLNELSEEERRLARDPYERERDLWEKLRASLPI